MFKVPSVDEAVKGKKILLAPYSPIDGFRVAVIEDDGFPIEFVETNLSDQELASLEG